MPLDIKAALICDLAREEKTGKFILVGVYTGDIIFLNKPALFAPVFWVEVATFIKDANMEIESKIDVPGKRKPLVFTATTSVERQDKALLVVGTKPFEITEEGTLRLSMRPKGARRWTEVIAKAVRFAESSPPAS